MTAIAAGTLEASGGRPVRWAATGRPGGVSRSPFASLNLADHVGDDPADVAHNRANVTRLVHATAVATVGAVHGGRAAWVTEPGQVDGVDALVTNVTGLALLARGADCALIALADPSAGVIGVAHCGWRGLVEGIVPATVEALVSAGARSIQAVVGPSICADCYPVPADRVALVRDRAPGPVADAACRVERSGAWIDVAAGVRAHLRLAGIDAVQTGGCTAERDDLFSYRRDGRTGRQGMIIAR